MSDALTDTPLSALAPTPAGHAPEPLFSAVFAPRLPMAQVVYKRRRRLTAGDEATPTPEAAAAAGERRPRVVLVAPPPTPSAAPTPAAEPQATGAQPPPRRRRRDPVRAPGEVRHIVFERPEPTVPNPADSESPLDALLRLRATYPDLQRSLAALERTLQQVHDLQRCATGLRALLPRRS